MERRIERRRELGRLCGQILATLTIQRNKQPLTEAGVNLDHMIDSLSLDLGPTRTYGRRSACWIPVDETDERWDGRTGSLITNVQKAAGYGRRCEVDSYAVEEVPLEPGEHGRAFLLVKTDPRTDDPAADEVYRCVVNDRGGRCTCKAGSCRVEVCKHRDALALVISYDVLPTPAWSTR